MKYGYPRLSCLAAGLLFCFFLGFPAFSAVYTVESVPNTHIQDRRAYLSDPDGIIGASEAGAINRTAGELERALGVEAALVVVGSIGDAEPRDFANKLFKRWGIGKAGKDNGLLILLR